jgi:hypothetical protein
MTAAPPATTRVNDRASPPSTTVMPSPRSCRRGTAALEFALVAPIMALMGLGLADSVRRTLAQIDLDAAAHAGARAAVAGRRVDAAIAALDPALAASVTAIDCTARLGLSGGCTALPPGRYVAVTLTDRQPSLFGADRDDLIEATALVRLP